MARRSASSAAAFFAPLARLASVFSSAARSFIAARSCTENPPEVSPLVVIVASPRSHLVGADHTNGGAARGASRFLTGSPFAQTCVRDAHVMRNGSPADGRTPVLLSLMTRLRCNPRLDSSLLWSLGESNP
ncbi:hypothetical protein ACFFX0_19915 [Citricoccus parietis]|uniref:Secreted protein n=1 Tax=Citricoccus parietis TaxID=592307 RepID=A0ABV5G323_9MICC